MALLIISCGLSGARAELVGTQPEPVFDADGLMVDEEESSEVNLKEDFRAGIKPYSTWGIRDPVAPSKPLRIRIPVQADTSPQGAAQEKAMAAYAYVKQQNWAKALEEIQQGLKLDPNNIQLVQSAAAFAALAKKFEVADEYFKQVLEDDPDNVPFMTGRAGVLIRLRRFKEADLLIQRALVLDPTYSGVRFDELCIQIGRGDTNIPAGHWEMLSTDELNGLVGWLDADKQDYLNALSPKGYKKLCDKVLGPGTDSYLTEIVSLLNTAASASQKSQWDEAESALRKIKEIGVHAVGVDIDIGRTLFEKGDHAAALAYFKALADKHPESSLVLYDYAYILINLQLYDEAGAVLERVCQLDPKDGQAAFALACMCAVRGQMDKAWPILTALVSTHAAEMLGWLMGDQPYLKPIHDDPRYAKLRRALRSARPATP